MANGNPEVVQDESQILATVRDLFENGPVAGEALVIEVGTLPEVAHQPEAGK